MIGKKIISFSLWGNNPKYCIGAIKNIQLAKIYYPEWFCRFYYASDVPEQYLREMKEYDYVELFEKEPPYDWRSMFWRFEAIADDNVEVMLSRDTDSRFCEREVLAVNEWLKSDKLFHIMRDHPTAHRQLVMPGMFGAKKGIIDDVKSLIKDFVPQNYYGTDYLFFNQIKNRFNLENTMVHDDYIGKPFPSPIKNKHFIGQVFNEDDKPQH